MIDDIYPAAKADEDGAESNWVALSSDAPPRAEPKTSDQSHANLA